ncbi:MAG: sulfate adenylyltransferase [Planctomycetes bacterium]|nr:sulfate adenylyltransferase [Planctomycetota bacterium]
MSHQQSVPPRPALVQLQLHGDALASAQQRAAQLPRLGIDRNMVLDVEKLANGTFSPLTGFMGSADYHSVLNDVRLAAGTPWSIPIILQCAPEKARGLSAGMEVLLWNEAEDIPSAILTLSEVHSIDLLEQARKVYGTEDSAHPGVKRMLSLGTCCLAGGIALLAHSKSLIPAAYDQDPSAVRAEIDRRGFRTVTGFQTRNLGHKAHEHLQKVGLELTDGLLIHPLIGWKKAGDMLPEIILEGYEILIENYYPREKVMLAGLTTAMRYAGPREALFHAIIRRNFGCTHFIVGRDHAGVGNYYEKYAGHRIFDRFTAVELGITPLRLHGPCYCSRCDEIVTEQICPHGPAAWRDISGTEVRAMIARGEEPPATIMRPEIARFLIAKGRSGAVFFEER